MKTPLIVALSIVGVLATAGTAMAVNAGALSSAPVDLTGASQVTDTPSPSDSPTSDPTPSPSGTPDDDAYDDHPSVSDLTEDNSGADDSDGGRDDGDDDHESHDSSDDSHDDDDD